MPIQREVNYTFLYTEEHKARAERKDCIMCGLPRKEWKRKIASRCCSKECTEKHDETLLWWPAKVRWRCLERDKDTCVKCGTKPYDASSLTADHIKPIALGGSQWDLSNLQTLCRECNREKTAQDAKDIAQLRAIEKKMVAGQTTL